MKYPRIFEEFGKADGIISPIGQTLDTLLAAFLCAAGDNGRVFFVNVIVIVAAVPYTAAPCQAKNKTFFLASIAREIAL